MKRHTIAAAMAIVIIAGHAVAREIAYFPGTASVPPISLTDEACTGEPGSYRSIAHIANRFTHADDRVESCWYRTDMGGRFTSKRVVAACMRATGRLGSAVTSDCLYVDKKYFVDPRTLPKAAFQ